MTTTPTVVITGASGGIGRATALRLSAAGCKIIAHYAHNLPAAELTQEQVVTAGGSCVLVQADLAQPSGILDLTESVYEYLDSAPDEFLLGLVNNAAQLLGPSFASATVSDFDSYFALNTRAPFFLTQALSKRMPPGGSIVNVSSAGAHFSSPSDIVYAMSKTALESFTTNAAEALASAGVRINTVVPGFTDNGHDAFQDPAVRSYLSTFSVFGDVSRPSAVAEAIAFLLSDSSARTTGSVLDVSGGSTLGVRPKAAFSLRSVATDGLPH